LTGGGRKNPVPDVGPARGSMTRPGSGAQPASRGKPSRGPQAAGRLSVDLVSRPDPAPRLLLRGLALPILAGQYLLEHL